jgi:hypothetical protein
MAALECVNAFHAADAKNTLAARPTSVKRAPRCVHVVQKTVLRRRAPHFRKRRQSPKLATTDVYRKPIAPDLQAQEYAVHV